MELKLEQIGVLLLNMNMCRQNVKKHFKKTNKDLIEQYDSVKTHLKTVLDINGFEGTETLISLYLSTDELKMVSSFISWYVPASEGVIKKAYGKVGGEDRQQLNALVSIKKEIEVALGA
ncbi:hypothetical protein [Amphibacillus cookii]|uniref:hypothetical protein n=1 Tax=Amphibacillus cookii TaxID=767787 RepID=UPI001957D625|nr:hypothetical protein [Amphibacillus cookii]MBM7543264.1 hypothetical protein [Amphibacillus cookii]